MGVTNLWIALAGLGDSGREKPHALHPRAFHVGLRWFGPLGRGKATLVWSVTQEPSGGGRYRGRWSGRARGWLCDF